MFMHITFSGGDRYQKFWEQRFGGTEYWPASSSCPENVGKLIGNLVTKLAKVKPANSWDL